MEPGNSRQTVPVQSLSTVGPRSTFFSSATAPQA